MSQNFVKNVTSMTEGGLPSLKGGRAGSRPISGEVNPAHLKREVTRLYPRIQSIEKEINTLKQQLPTNLNQVIIQLRQDIEKLTGNDSDAPETDTPLKEKLADLENRLQLQLEVSLKASTDDLEKRIKDLQVTKPKVQPRFVIDEVSESTFDNRINILKEMLESQKSKTQTRLKKIEQNIEKLTKQSDQVDSYKQLEALNSSVDANRREISALRSKLSDLRTQLDKQAVREEIQTQQMESPTGRATSKAIEVPSVPDLSQPMSELEKEITEMSGQYQERLKEMRDRASKCDQRVKQVDRMAVEIVTATATLEARITEADSLCRRLSEQVRDITEKANTDTNTKFIKQLTDKIVEEQKALFLEIDALRNKAKKCQDSIKANAPPESVED